VIVARALSRLSAAIAAVERVALMVLIASVAGFVLMNVGARAVGVTVAWADEIAIYSMILSGFVGASLMLRARTDPAVLLLHEVLPGRAVKMLRTVISAVALGFGIMLIHLCWRWFDPARLAAAGFDVPAFEGATFNFIYTDTTPIMGLPFFWFYLVMPVFALAITVHAATNMLEDLGLVERVEDPSGATTAGG
jgi:TRAP-type C4-dicarboxylate transport system permease small subunit